MKRFLTALLAGCVFIAMTVHALAAGPEKITEYDERFTDVPSGNWAEPYIAAVYEYGLMNGISPTTFSPGGSMTVAEAVAVTARLHDMYAGGGADFSGGRPWYMPYIAYAEENGMIGPWLGTDYSRPVTREEFALCISNAISDELLPAINDIPDLSIPEVGGYPMADAALTLENAGVSAINYSTMFMDMFLTDVLGEDRIDTAVAKYNAIYRLYNAGVLTGNDEYGSFSPKSDIRRDAVAAILCRVVEPETRCKLAFTPKSASLVPVDKLTNLKSMKKRMSDKELSAAYEAARRVVEPLANLSREAQLCGIAAALRAITEASVDYSMDSPHYNDPYGFFVLGAASCAGCTRATGLCLNMLGIPYEHVNENRYSHQWTRVEVNGEYWICDAYGLYVGPEPAPYAHPTLG